MENERERLERLKHQLSKDRAISAENQRHEGRMEIAEQSKQIAEEKGNYAVQQSIIEAQGQIALERLKAELEPEKLENLHLHNKKERHDIRINNELEYARKTEIDMDKMILEAQIKKALMEPSLTEEELIRIASQAD